MTLYFSPNVDANGNVFVVTPTGSSLVVGGNVANNTAESGNPVLIAGTYDASPAARTSGNRSRLQTAVNGSLYVNVKSDIDGNLGRVLAASSDGAPGSDTGLLTSARGLNFNGTTWDRQRGDTVAASVLPGLSSTFWNYAAAAGGIVSSTAGVTIKAAAGASVRNYISATEVSWGTLSAATEFVIRDGASGTVIYRTILPTTAGAKPIPLNGPLRGTANTLLEIATLSAVTGGVFFNCTGFTGA